MASRTSVEAFVKEAFPNKTFDEAKKSFREFFAHDIDRLTAAEKAYRNLVVLLLRNRDFPEPKVTSRIKDRDECIRKFEEKYRGTLEAEGKPYEIKDHITDLVGLRVVCLYESDIDAVAALLKEHFEVIDETDKTKQLSNLVNGFGYKGLHLDLRLDAKRKTLPEYSAFADTRFEVQIRTIVQDAWSEVDHKLKYKKRTPLNLQRRIHRLAAIFELADQEFQEIRDLSTKLEQDAASDQVKSGEDTTSLDVFGFLKVCAGSFPEYDFYGPALEQILSDIEKADGDFTVAGLRSAIKNHKKTVDKYFGDLVRDGATTPAPYTVIRHALYLSDNSKFGGMIFANHRRNVDAWLERGRG